MEDALKDFVETEEDKQIYEEFMRAKLKLYHYFNDKFRRKFYEETHDKIIDYNHWLFRRKILKYNTSEEEDDNNNCKPDKETSLALKLLFSELALKYHPDKTQRKTEQIFIRINNLYKNGDYHGLVNLAKELEDGEDLTLDDLRKEINDIEKSMPYWYAIGELRDSLREIFLDPQKDQEKIRQMHDELQERIKILTEDNARLQKLLSQRAVENA